MMMREEVPHKGAKVYMYTRVSTLIQVDGYSLEAQKKAIERETEYQGMTIAGEYSDEGKSGKDIKGRPAFQRMMSDIINGKDDVSFVMVFKLSRFGRNAADILSSIKTMKLYGVHLICVEDRLDSSVSTGKLMIAFLSAMAEVERDNILTQTQAGRLEKAHQGLYNGGLTPYGYKVVDDRLVVVPEEAEVVKIIFDKYVNTELGPSGVAQWLNSMGYKKTKKRAQEVEFFTRPFILKIIQNPVYLGHVAYGKTTTVPKKDDPESVHRVEVEDYVLAKNAHEAIVSQGLYDDAQKKRISMKGKKEKKEAEHEYLLSGLLKCPQCGKSLYGIPMRNRQRRKDGTLYPVYYAYACRPTISDRQRGSTCNFGQVSCHKIDNPVRDILIALDSSESFGQRLESLADEKLSISECQKRIETAEEKLRQAYKKQQFLETQQYNLDSNSPHYSRQYDKLERQLSQVYEDLDTLEKERDQEEAKLEGIKQQGLSRESLYESLKLFARLYDQFSDRDKKAFLQTFIQSIELYPEKSRKDGCAIKAIHFRFPVSYKGELVYTLNIQKGGASGTYPLKLNDGETVCLLSKLQNRQRV